MFELTKQTVRMSNFNARSELNGETRKPAADISCSALMPNTILNVLCPGLLGMLYEAPKNPDLAEQADPDALTALRLPLLGLPLKWSLELENRTLTIDYGLGGDSDIILPECKVHKFTIEPQNGGSVLLGWQISAHPDATQAGWLYDHQQQDIVITLEAEKVADNQGSLLQPRKSKKEKQAEAMAEAQALFVAGDGNAAANEDADEKTTVSPSVLKPAEAWPFPKPN